MEEFRDVKGYEGLYQVSNLGSVKSLSRMVNGKASLRRVRERLLKSGLDKSGYQVVVLSKEDYQKTFTIHKLVAIMFLNHTPSGMSEVVDHIDNNKLNNNEKNLQLITTRDNVSKSKTKASSVYTGVYWHKQCKKWAASISINHNRVYLGLFTKEHDAHLAYQKKLSSIIN